MDMRPMHTCSPLEQIPHLTGFSLIIQVFYAYIGKIIRIWGKLEKPGKEMEEKWNNYGAQLLQVKITRRWHLLTSFLHKEGSFLLYFPEELHSLISKQIY